MGLFGKKKSVEVPQIEAPKSAPSSIQEGLIDTKTFGEELRTAYLTGTGKLKPMTEEVLKEVLCGWAKELPAEIERVISKNDPTVYIFNSSHSSDRMRAVDFLYAADIFANILQTNYGFDVEVGRSDILCIRIKTESIKNILDETREMEPAKLFHQQGIYR